MFQILWIVLVVNIVLKLAGIVAWSWWFVFWPTWATLSFTVLLLGSAFIADVAKGYKDSQ